MATGGVSANISIGDLAETPPSTDYEGDDSFVVLGRSPTSFTFNDDASIMLQDALKSLEHVQLSAADDETEREETKLSNVEESGKEREDDNKTSNSSVQTNTNSLANLSLEEIQAKIEKMILENSELKETIHQNNMAMKKQCETILQWQEDVQRVHDSHKAKFEETKQYIEKLQMENMKLKEELEKAGQKQMALDQKSSVENLQQFQLEVAQKKIDDLELALKNKEAELEDLNGKLKEAETLADKYKTEFDLVKATYEKERQVYHKKVAQLVGALDDAKEAIVEKLTAPSPNEQFETLRQQLMNAQMHITELEMQRTKYQHIIHEKDLEYRQLSSTMADNDDVCTALRAQLDVYKSDFEAEASAKNALLAEKNQLAEDLQNLQRRNQQLIEEVERLRHDGDFVNVPRPRHTSSSTLSNDSPPPLRYTCPLCAMQFRSLRFIEEHVEHCVNNAP